MSINFPTVMWQVPDGVVLAEFWFDMSSRGVEWKRGVDGSYWVGEGHAQVTPLECGAHVYTYSSLAAGRLVAAMNKYEDRWLPWCDQCGAKVYGKDAVAHLSTCPFEVTTRAHAAKS